MTLRLMRSDGRVLIRIGMTLSDWAERWFPGALIFAMVAIVIVVTAGLFVGSNAGDLVSDFGDGFWRLIPFTMQMAMIVVAGYVVASSPPVARVMRWLASIPRTPRGTVAFVAFIALTSSLLSWGFSLVFRALFVREVVQRVRGVDYRAAGAAAYLGVGTVWALGLSSSAALLMAARGSIPPELLRISGRISLTQTIFTWQSGLTALLLITVSVGVAYLSAPADSDAKTAETFRKESSSLRFPRMAATSVEWVPAKECRMP
jgi:short-chain fatty acids transporter